MSHKDFPSYRGEMEYVCLGCGARRPGDTLLYTCPDCGGVFLLENTRFDALRSTSGQQWRAIFDERAATRTTALRGIFRYYELLAPLMDEEDIVYLGEGLTPIIEAAPALRDQVGVPFAYKNDGQNPSASFKDRGMACAFSYLKWLCRRHNWEEVLTVCASTGEWLGGTATTGVSEFGFLYGLSGWWYTIANGIGVLFLGLCFAKLFRSLNMGTVPGIIEKLFSVNARTVSCVILTIVMLAVGLSQMIAAGKLGESLLGFPFWISCVGFAVIFIIYTLAGGMNAVASTNVLHLLVMYIGVALAMVIAISGTGGISEFLSGVNALGSAEGGKSFWNMFSIGGSKVSSWIIASLLGKLV